MKIFQGAFLDDSGCSCHVNAPCATCMHKAVCNECGIDIEADETKYDVLGLCVCIDCAKQQEMMDNTKEQLFSTVFINYCDKCSSLPFTEVEEGVPYRCLGCENELIEKESSTVIHPDHYNQGSVECIDALQACLTPQEFIGFCRGNVIKYLWRTHDKGGVEDIQKAQWYLNKLKEVINV